VDHRTLVAQRDEALELALAAQERGDEGAELHETVRAMSLDRPPLPQLSLGGVAAQGARHRGSPPSASGTRSKRRRLRSDRWRRSWPGQVRDWLDRAAERVMDRLGSGQSELALAGGRDGREEEPDLATRLRDAWEARQGREKETGCRCVGAGRHRRILQHGCARRQRVLIVKVSRIVQPRCARAVRQRNGRPELEVAQEQETGERAGAPAGDRAGSPSRAGHGIER